MTLIDNIMDHDVCSGRIRIKQNVTPKWVYWLNQVDMAVVTSVNNG